MMLNSLQISSGDDSLPIRFIYIPPPADSEEIDIDNIDDSELDERIAEGDFEEKRIVFKLDSRYEGKQNLEVDIQETWNSDDVFIFKLPKLDPKAGTYAKSEETFNDRYFVTDKKPEQLEGTLVLKKDGQIGTIERTQTIDGKKYVVIRFPDKTQASDVFVTSPEDFVGTRYDILQERKKDNLE